MPHEDDLARALADLTRGRAFEVQAAIDAHVEWKRRLRDAVIRGYSEVGSDDAGRDDLCPLGRWLGTLPPEDGAGWGCEVVAEVHARFHREAAVVVQYLELGRIGEARAALDPDSGFDRASAELVGLLEAWQAAA